MIQCKDCEFCQRDEQGNVMMSCDPFATIIEPECLAKWQLVKTNQLLATYQATLGYYNRMAPMQEKMFKVMEREIDDIDEAEKWKTTDDNDNDEWTDSSGDR